MKKLLLGTTAIVGASVLMSGAALAADKPTLTIGGFGLFEAWFWDEDGADTGVPGTGKNAGRNRGQSFSMDETELLFKAKGVADNGLEYGFYLEWEAEHTSDNTGGADEAALWLSGNWGMIEMGDNDGAEDIVKVGGYTLLGGAAGPDGEAGSRTFTTQSVALIPAGMGVGDTGDATKITYMSPDISGFKFGISYTPMSNHDIDEAISDNNAGSVEDHLGIGAMYAGTFGDVGLKISGRYMRANSQTPGTYEDTSVWGAGAHVSYAGFTVGVGYADLGDSNITKAAKADKASAGTWWDVGANYVTGPYKIAANYAVAAADQATGSTDDTVKWTAVTFDYTVAPGLAVYFEYDHVKIDQSGTTTDNEVNAFVVGTKVSF